MNGTVKVDGLRELLAALRKVEAGHPKVMASIHKDAAQIVVDDARPRIRSRSGRLASTLRTQAGQRYGRAVAGYNRAALIYAPINHFGGYPGDYQGNPFLYDAADAQQSNVVDVYVMQVDDFLDAVFASL